LQEKEQLYLYKVWLWIAPKIMFWRISHTIMILFVIKFLNKCNQNKFY
jgi:hypothetical protein